MKKFWEWMIEERKYCRKKDVVCTVYSGMVFNSSGIDIPFTKQSLIGYMIEYLISNIEQEDRYSIKIDFVNWDIDNIYDNLVQQIEKLK